MSDYEVLGLMSMQSFRRVMALVLPLALACLLAAGLLLGLAVSAARAGGVIVVGGGLHPGRRHHRRHRLEAGHNRRHLSGMAA